MLSKNKIKLIRSLSIKKYRDAEQLFVAEGEKLVFDLLSTSLTLFEIFCTEELFGKIQDQSFIDKTSVVKKEELEKISSLKTVPNIIALFRIPESTFDPKNLGNDLSIVLDGVQDPGNLGTIVRLADWFGIKWIFCSRETADIFNPKAVQSTMGAIARVKLHYLELEQLFSEARKQNIPVYGTYLEGENLYTTSLSANGLIVMGNEGQGIQPQNEQFISRKLNIPPFPAGQDTSESLNVGVATAIVCSEFRRRLISKG